jgi:hypothetical protein
LRRALARQVVRVEKATEHTADAAGRVVFQLFVDLSAAM